MVSIASGGSGGQDEALAASVVVIFVGYVMALWALALAFRPRPDRGNRAAVLLVAAFPILADLLAIGFFSSELPGFGKAVIAGSGVVALLAIVVSFTYSRKWSPDRRRLLSLDDLAADLWARQLRVPKQPAAPGESRRAA